MELQGVIFSGHMNLSQRVKMGCQFQLSNTHTIVYLLVRCSNLQKGSKSDPTLTAAYTKPNINGGTRMIFYDTNKGQPIAR